MINDSQDAFDVITLPDSDDVFVRICSFHINKNGVIQPEAFMPRKPDNKSRIDDCGVKSCNWSKLSTVTETINQSRSKHCRDLCAIVNIGFVRQIDLEVTHFPNEINRGHCGIHSKVPQRILRETCKRECAFEQPNEQLIIDLLDYVILNERLIKLYNTE